MSSARMGRSPTIFSTDALPLFAAKAGWLSNCRGVKTKSSPLPVAPGHGE